MITEALNEALGFRVIDYLRTPTVTDILLNEDSNLWIDSIDYGRVNTGYEITEFDVNAALRLIAHYCGVPLTGTAPLLSANLPTGERIAATIPPITRKPTFAIRVPPKVTFDESDFYSTSAVDSRNWHREAEQQSFPDMIDHAIKSRKNVLICGGTGSGKTSLLSSMLKRPEIANDRVLVIEDTAELDLRAIPDSVRFLTSPEIDQRRLVEHALRYRPDRIILGEVRSGYAALEMITAMNTGHSGSFATLHCDSAKQAITRLENLCSRVCSQTPSQEITEAIGCIIFVAKTSTGRQIKEVIVQ